LFVLLVFGFLFISLIGFVNSIDETTPVATESVLNNQLPDWLQPIATALSLGSVWNTFIIGLIIIFILIAGIYDILELTSIFQTPLVKWAISIGLGLIFVLVGLINKITIFMVGLVSGFGAFAIWIEIIIAIVIFIGMIFGGMWAAKWAAKRYAMRAKINAIKGGAEAGSAISELRTMWDALAEKKKKP
jgi:hypothetical protein